MSTGPDGEKRTVVYEGSTGSDVEALASTRFMLKATAARTEALVNGGSSPHQQETMALTETARRLVLTHSSRALGSEVSGDAIDFAAQPDEEAVQALRSALLRRRVLFFREPDAERVTTANMLEWGGRMGVLEDHPFMPKQRGEGRVAIFHFNEKIMGGADLWHMDGSWRETVPFAGFIRLKVCPPLGGDTLFCDMVAACASLNPALRARLRQMHALHHDPRFLPTLQAQIEQGTLTADQFERVAEEHNQASWKHPIVTTHPETGEEMLRVNPGFTRYIVGLPDAESKALLQQLYWHCFGQPEFHCRFKWTEGAICLWDNRCVAHYATSDYWPHVRRVERVCCLDDARFHLRLSAENAADKSLSSPRKSKL